jgi:thiamine phosphate synthase YjbQ (UPF0047 family)
MLGNSETVPVSGGQLKTGVWQARAGFFFFDRPRARRRLARATAGQLVLPLCLRAVYP